MDRSFRRALDPLLRDVAQADRVYLCLDFDGTLASISDTPGSVDMATETRTCLRSLSRSAHVTPAIISGRSVADVRSRVGLNALTYAGNHGLVIERDGGRWVHEGVSHARPVLERMAESLTSALQAIDGAFVEDKYATLSVHYRTVRESEVPSIRTIVREHLERVDELRTEGGKAVIQIRPDIEWGKGDAVRRITRPVPGELTIFAGDDRTDMHAFRTLDMLPGRTKSIGVGDDSLPADLHLDDPNEVQVMLRTLHQRAASH